MGLFNKLKSKSSKGQGVSGGTIQQFVIYGLKSKSDETRFLEEFEKAYKKVGGFQTFFVNPSAGVCDKFGAEPGKDMCFHVLSDEVLGNVDAQAVLDAVKEAARVAASSMCPIRS